MRSSYKAAILIFILLILSTGRVWASETEYDGDQIILSWTQDNAHSQTITWHSAGKKEGYVQYNLKGGKLSGENQIKATITEVKDGEYYRYEATIEGLKQKTLYDYRVGDGSKWSKVMNFTTAPIAERSGLTASDDENSFEFLYLGDVQYANREKDYPIWGRMVQDIRQRNPGIAFALLGGDMVNSSRKMKDWNLFLSNASPVFSHIPMMTTIGNHETSVKADIYLKAFALPENGPDGVREEFYSFDYADCHIAVLNTSFLQDNRKAVMEEKWREQMDEINRWLEKDLTESEAQWKIALIHHPAYGISDGDPISDQIREEWEPIFEKGGIDLVLCGHQHIYMRTKELGGITYVMGNSGKRRSAYYNGENFPDYGKALDATNSNYQIIKVNDDELSLESYDEEGQIIDKWTKKADKMALLKAAAAAGIIVLVAGTAVFIRLRRNRRRSR